MRKKIVITVLLVIGLSALIYVLYRGDLISQFSSQPDNFHLSNLNLLKTQFE